MTRTMSRRKVAKRKVHGARGTVRALPKTRGKAAPAQPEEAPQTAKLFATGGSQAVRLPKDFRFEGSEVEIRREGDKVILEPLRGWSRALLEALGSLRGEEIPRPGSPLVTETRDPWG